MEEEVDAGVPRGRERWRRVLRERLRRRRLSRFVEVGVEQIQEHVTGSGRGRLRRGAEALRWWAEEGVGHCSPASRRCRCHLFSFRV